MKLTIKKALSVFMCVMIVVLSCTLAFATENADTNNSLSGEDAAGYIDEAVALIMSRYKFDVEREDLYKSALKEIITQNPELLDTAFKGLFNELDDYSVYYTEDELNSFIDSMSGQVCGIGVLVLADSEGLIVSNVYDNSPAKEAGIIQGDIITHAGEVYLGGMDIDLAKQHIIGAENTPVTITVSRNGVSEVKTLTRRTVQIDAGLYQIVENGTLGYIQLTEFNDTASEFIKKALNDFDKNNIKNIILDLRNNPGGALKEYVDVCSLFIPTGPAIHIEYKNPLRFTTLYAENESEDTKYNLAVLINENSASAAEAFAAAVQDTGVGIVIGEKSFGKGTMQNITYFKIGGGIKLTEAVYLSPNFRQVNGVGVTPDVVSPDKISEYKRADLVPMTYERVLKLGDKGKDVEAIEERLRLLGLFSGVPDEEYDNNTYMATLSFQKATELYPYGVMDYTTQAKLDGALQASEVKSDTSYKKAVEIFKSGNWQEYKQDWSNSLTDK